MRLMLCFFAICISGNSFSKVIATLAEKVLQVNIKEATVVNTENGLRFSYCPDNTCDVLDITTSDKSVAWDIGFVFLYYESTYIYLKTFKGKNDYSNVLDDISSKYKLECLKANYKECIYSKLLKKYIVTQKFARYDEGILVIE